ncbi:MAG: NHL repeat-containing protein, partial [Verrucomicrobiota bacterium]
KFEGPAGIFVTKNGTLWVADENDHRILRFDNAASLNGEVTANQVVGQPDLSTFDEDTTRNSLYNPWGIWIDASGNLYVGDYTNNRVLRFDDIESAGNGPDASIVIGQEDFTSNSEGTDARGLHTPYYVLVSPTGTLWVGDYSNNRYLGFRDAANLSSNPAADIVVGQPDFETIDERTPSNRDLLSANSITVDPSGNLFFGDYSGNRILRYSDPVVLNVPKRKRTQRPRTTIRGTSSGAEFVQYRVKGQRGGYRLVRGSAESWSARIRKLSRRKTLVFARAWAFDNRLAEGRSTVIYRPK